MKKVLLACLLGFGTLLPVNEAKSSIATQNRILNIHIEGWALTANSDAASGLIEEIQVFELDKEEPVLTESCDGYSCTIKLGELPAGVYVAVVITTNTTGKKQFSIN
jgi:hypothetical protein